MSNHGEKGAIEDVRDMKSIKIKLDAALPSIPDPIDECNEALFKTPGLKQQPKKNEMDFIAVHT